MPAALPVPRFVAGPPAVLITLASILVGSGAGCASHCQGMAHRPAPVPPSETVPYADSRPMLVFRPAPADAPAKARPILLLHEIPGLNECTTVFADNLAKKGFTVYAPVMVGRPLESGGWAQARNELAVFLSPDWPTLRTNKSPAIIPALRNALRKIREAHPDSAIGLIGMCMSGTIPLALIDEPNVSIAAICQPALPFSLDGAHAQSLGLSDDDVRKGVAAVFSRNLRVLGFRFESDTISPAARMQTLRDKLGEHYEDNQVTLAEKPEKAHATFTFCYDDTVGAPTRKRFDHLVDEFTRALDAPVHK